MRSGNWSQAIAEVIGENRISDGDFRSLVFSLNYYLRAALVPDPVKLWLRNIYNRRQDKIRLDASLISQDFARRVDIADRFGEHRRTFSRDSNLDFTAERIQAIRPNVTAGRERYARIASLLGMEARDPFLDKRVVEYSASLPGHLRMRNGIDKFVLRELMQDRLPGEVAWGGRKPHIGWLFNQEITQSLLASDAISRDCLQNGLAEFVDIVALGAAWQSFRNSGFNENINKALYLSTWLWENANRPVVPDHEIL